LKRRISNKKRYILDLMSQSCTLRRDGGSIKDRFERGRNLTRSLRGYIMILKGWLIYMDIGRLKNTYAGSQRMGKFQL